MGEFIAGMVLGAFISILSAMSAINDIKAERVSDCDNFGAFMVDDVKYECRRADK